jgi:hypothetical protein
MRHRTHFSPAMVIACLALAISLGGVSYAATRLPANSVGSKQIIDRSLKKKDMAPKTLSGIQGVRPRTLGGVAAVGGRANGSNVLFTDSISFPFTLALPPAVNRIGVGEPVTAACPSANPPQAAEGNFCFYESARANLNFRGFVDPASNRTGAAGVQGVELQYQSNGSGDASAHGTWAVTATP